MTTRDDLYRQREAVPAIAARHGGSNLLPFGSVLRGQDRPDSDVDLLIDFAEDRGFDDYLAMVEALGGTSGPACGRRHRSRSLSPHFRPYIEAEARPV